MTLGETLDVGLRVFRDSIIPLLIINLMLQVPYGILVYFALIGIVESGGSPLWMGILTLLGVFLIQPLALGATTKLIADRYLGNNTGIGHAIQSTLRVLPGLFGAVFVAGLLTGLGFLLLIIPGLILMVRFAVVAPSVIVERRGGFTALKRSSNLSKGLGWQFFATFIILGAIGYVANITIEFMLTDSVVIYLIANWTMSALISAFGGAVWAVSYFSARCEKEGFDLEVLAQSVE